MNYKENRILGRSEVHHTFVICAYERSPYLEECILSVINQSIRSNILMATSTPNDYIENLADKYDIPLYVRDGKPDIAKDWNYAIQVADGELVTLVHQDDVYDSNYLKRINQKLMEYNRPLIAFSNYGEIRDGKEIRNNCLLRIKSIMLFPFRFHWVSENSSVKHRILAFGNPICCPAVTYVKKNLKLPLFSEGFGSNIDWQLWERLSKEKGAFSYVPECLVYHRIHKTSTTSELISNNKRTEEDFEMLCRFWPKWIARVLLKIYCKGQKSNKL